MPFNPLVLDIFDKYQANKNKLLYAISNQKFNDYIKEACKLAGLTEQGRFSTEPPFGVLGMRLKSYHSKVSEVQLKFFN